MSRNIDTAALRALAEKATPGRWGVFGMTVLASTDGASNADTATEVCVAFTRDANGKPRTFDADLIAAAREAVPALCDEVDQLRLTVGEARVSANALKGQNLRLHKRLRTERDEARAALDRVRALHFEKPGWYGSWCAADFEDWPCPTIRTLDGGVS